jgi:hypothetical protein
MHSMPVDAGVPHEKAALDADADVSAGPPASFEDDCFLHNVLRDTAQTVLATVRQDQRNGVSQASPALV